MAQVLNGGCDLRTTCTNFDGGFSCSSCEGVVDANGNSLNLVGDPYRVGGCESAPPFPEPEPEPEPEPVGTVPCANFDDLQERMSDIEHECCDGPDDDCGTGFPATCDAHCAAVLIPIQTACAKYLSSQKLLAAAKAGIDAAAAVCPAAPECSDYNALERLTNDVNHECCDGPNQDCASGFPSTCNAACAAVLLPMQAACAEYLSSTPLLAGAKDSIDAAAALC